MDIQQLKAFYEVARWHSFSKAAKELYLSQPAVSRQISSLETEIGLPLFIRMANHVSLTDSGRKLLAYAEEIIHTFEQATRTIQDLRDLRQGTVTVAADSFLSQYFLPRFAGEFHRRYPSLQIQIRTHPHADLPQLLTEGQIDLAFFCGMEPAENLPLTLEPLYQEQLFLVTPAKPNLKAKGQASASPEMYQPNPAIPDRSGKITDIAGAVAEFPPFLFPPSTYSFTKKYTELLPPELSSAEAPITVDSLEGIKTLLLSGFGCSILPESLINLELEQQHLQGIPLNSSFPIILTYPKDSRLPHPVLLLIGIIRKLINQ
ncbi:LysR substrate-binding domain-containing protein [Paradesulfitobacterium aromaticivorans]